MAQGNIGNLLQHFVALNCAERLLNHQNQPTKPVVYVDCFSMAPWESVPGENREGFLTHLQRFDRKASQNDLVARTFMTAWTDHYQLGRVPAALQDREYPNTAVLLRAAFPQQVWEMRLHEIVDEKQRDLKDWASKQPLGTCRVGDCWRKSPLLCQNAAIPPETPAFLMLDPYRIVRDNRNDNYRDGYIDGEQIRTLIGGWRLSIDDRPSDGNAAPALLTLFSFSDTDAEGTDELVRDSFKYEKWNVETVRSAPKRTYMWQTQHIGWVVSCGLPSPILGQSLQAAWDDWLS